MTTSTVRAQEASSSAPPPRFTYHVFLSFRGEDTRKTFTDHLYTALDRVGFHTFRDDDGIERGENIDFELQRAIQESRISIIVFSKDYASSRWCLDELGRILERKRTSEHQVLPVFYDVDPSDVRKQTASFEESFLRHERRFKTKAIEERSQWMDKIEEWRAALREIADTAGMDLTSHDVGYESTFIQKIVTVVEEKLRRTPLNIPRKPIGLRSRARDINLWLKDGSNDIHVCAISGVGGIGKTTLAKYVYNENFKRFEGSTFLANVSEISRQPNGLVCLQRQLLSHITNNRKEIHNIDEGIYWIKLALCRKRVLIVLDDVDEQDQINAVLGMGEWFYSGSKVLITTRHEWLLNDHGAFMVHRVECMDDHESLKLFSWHAFGQDYPTKTYVEHTERALKYCGGLPLALELLGSTLSGASVKEWINALEKLETIPNHQIFKKMRISYDSLSDDHDKNLFLHISCFFIGEDKDFVAKVLDGRDGCGFFTTIGIQVLVRRCMLNIEDNKVTMHRLLQDMGREIVRLEYPNKPEKRSRLWYQNDSCKVLREKLGTEKIEGLALDMHTFKEDKDKGEIIGVNKAKHIRMFSFGFSRPSVDTPFKDSNEVAFETNAFTRMRKLKILQLNYVELKGHYKEFPKGLKWLKWHGFPLKHLPNDFPLENVVALDMRYSNLRKVWKGAKILGLLKILNLSHSHSLVRTPVFGALPKLERLIMKDCTSLIEIHESIGSLERLVFMNVEDCINLKKLPKGIGMLKLLETFIMSGCSNVTQLPEKMKNMESLKVLHADRTALDPKTWAKPKKNLEMSWSWLPRSLVTLSLKDCNLSDDAFPRDFSSIPLLLDLNLNGNPICKLPDCVRSLIKLRELSFESCSKLQSLYRLPSVIRLSVCDCTSLERITLAPQASCSGYSTSGNDKLVEFEGDFKLEPIGEVDADIINSLGMCNLKSVANAEMNFFRSFLYNTKGLIRLPTQGLFEVGVFSTFIPGRELPIKEWLSIKYRNGPYGGSCGVFIWIQPSLSFTVHSRTSIPNHRSRIRCLNVGVVYSLSHHQQDWKPPPLGLMISNKTKDLSWHYSPVFMAIPAGKEHVMWLSQWKVGNQFRLEVGDEVRVGVVVDVYFNVKECGVNLVYEENRKETRPQLESAHPNCQGVSFPEHCRIGGAYIGSYSHYLSDWGSLSDWGKNYVAEESMRRLFEDEWRTWGESFPRFLALITQTHIESSRGFLALLRPMRRSPRAQDKKVLPEAATSGNKLDDHFGLPSDNSKDNDYGPDGSELDEKVKGDESSSDESVFDSGSEDFGASPNNNQKLKLPSDDSEDNDYDPDGSELDEKVKGDESSSNESVFYSASEDFRASPNHNQKLEHPSDDSEDDYYDSSDRNVQVLNLHLILRI